MTSTSASEPKQTWGDRLLAVGKSPLVKSIFVYGLPAYFLSTLLVRLSGGSLWIPVEWRYLVQAISIGAGLAVFRLCDAQEDSAEESGNHAAENRAIQRRALAWYGASLVLLTGFMYLRHTTLFDVDMTQERAVGFFNLEGSFQGQAANSDEAGEQLDLVFEHRNPPLHLERRSKSVNGTVLIPLGFLQSQTGLELKSIIEAGDFDADSGWMKPALSTELETTLNHLDNEKGLLTKTIALFLVVHVALCLALSAAYGYSYHVVEEFAVNLAT